MYDFKEGDRVRVELGPTRSVTGTICGKGPPCEPWPRARPLWVVRFDENPNPDPTKYPYSCAALPEVMLRPLEEE